MAKRKGAKSWRRSEAAHIRLYEKANYAGDSVKSWTSYFYHGECVSALRKEKRPLSQTEKRRIFAESRERALDYSGESPRNKRGMK